MKGTISLEELLKEVPAFRLCDPMLMLDPQYCQGACDGYFNTVSESSCIECSTYRKGVLAGIALWEVGLTSANHSFELFNRMFVDASASKTLLRIRLFIKDFSEFLDAGDEPGLVSLDTPSREEKLLIESRPLSLTESLPLDLRFMVSQLAQA